SEAVKREVDDFTADAGSNIHSISYRLARGIFNFEPAKGIPIPNVGADGKKSKTKFRPIVLAPLESRIVQRSVLEAIVSHKGMRKYIATPHSFGGVRKVGEGAISAVPAAVTEVLRAIGDGAKYVACADIQAFFTKIPKPGVRQMLLDEVKDEEFATFFDAAIKVELSNMAQLKEKADAFPTHEIGVAQGNSLSPLLGNILLYKFDKVMNEGDCRCIRYIDDFIILAPTRAAAKARMANAKKILAKFEMILSPEKSSKEPISIDEKFEFLGIEFNNGFIRPNQKSRGRLLAQLDEVLIGGTYALLQHEAGADFPKSQSLVQVLRRADGVIQGWGKHYRFSNDEKVFRDLDEKVKERLAKYIGAYVAAREKAEESEKQMLLGVERLRAIDRKPLKWPAPAEKSASIKTEAS
ncbi:MAG: RNA-dependent DNA polymerase, partial [Alphaproteobacteria bacterium]|nr:RNA-dependent DNA polymerase [Alphaproteobacteria bacterium]